MNDYNEIDRVHFVMYLDVFGPELFFEVEVHVAEVLFADGSGQRQQLAVQLGQDGQKARQVVQERVVVAAVVQRVQRHCPAKVNPSTSDLTKLKSQNLI